MSLTRNYFIFTLTFLFCATAFSQVTIKPHYGIYLPKMGDVNSKIENDIAEFRRITGQDFPDAGEISSDKMWGVQIEYHTGEDYFFNANVAFYDNTAESQFNSPLTSETFNYKRDVEMYDFMINLHYYIGYNSWGRFNKYMGAGVGLMVLRANSITQSNFGDPSGHFDSNAEFTGNTLSGLISAGGTLRLQPALFLWAEGGVQYGNFGELDGTITRLDAPERESIISDSQFDMTGFYVRGGIGLNLPFLR
ncbi:MAG: hypothetical protein ACRBF0_13740 [Calditrichia bacterium]